MVPAHESATALSDLGRIESADQRHAESANCTHRLRILLVDDSAVARVFAARLLEFAGHEVDVATDGRQAVEAVRIDVYDMILMDVHMPGMNGIEATIALRAGGWTLPILALSGKAAAEDFKDCLDAGMNGALEKPFNLDTFEREFRRIRIPTDDIESLIR